MRLVSNNNVVIPDGHDDLLFMFVNIAHCRVFHNVPTKMFTIFMRFVFEPKLLGQHYKCDFEDMFVSKTVWFG